MSFGMNSAQNFKKCFWPVKMQKVYLEKENVVKNWDVVEWIFMYLVRNTKEKIKIWEDEMDDKDT